MPTIAPRRELFAWAMYDFANSGYTTVVLTTIFNAYFVGVVVGKATGFPEGAGTLLWTVAVSIPNALVLVSAPMLGAIADHYAAKKRFLLVTTIGCILGTALLALTGPGDVWLAMTLVVLSNLTFATGENLIAAFLPEISDRDSMGRVSAYGWAVGYLGGLTLLGVCLAYVSWAQRHGFDAPQYVPVTMLIVAGMFALAATPTFLWLKERAVSVQRSPGEHSLTIGFQRLRHTLADRARFRDLFRFLIALMVYYCGINTVVVLAAVYAQEVMGFRTNDIIVLVMVVNVTAAVGAFLFGRVQDRLGSLPTLAITLLIWIASQQPGLLDRKPGWLLGRCQSGRRCTGFKPGQRPGAGGPIGAPRPRCRVFWAVGPGGQACSHRRPAELWADHLPDRRQPQAGYLIHRAVLCGWTHAVGHGQ